MSLSLTDYYCASIAPGSAALLLMRRGWRPVILEKSCASGVTKAGNSPWLVELGLLEGLLSEVGEVRRGLPLNIIISNHYMRYRLIPAPPLSMPGADVLALMQHCFREIYGDVVDGWQIRANPLPDGGDIVACAVDRALMEGLKAAAGKAGLRLVSAQPYFMNGFNAACRRIDGAATCFVQVESGRMILGVIRNKNWLGLRAVTASSEWQDELPAHIDREILFAGWEGMNPTIFLHVPEAAQSIKPGDTRPWRMIRTVTRPIAGYSPQHDVSYAMALSGV
ncbi:MAG: hypothetical protein ABL860_07250 [Candidatus Nitrotoga sp.]